MKFSFIFLLFRSNPIREYFFHQNRCPRKYFLGGCTKVGFGVYKSLPARQINEIYIHIYCEKMVFRVRNRNNVH